ncbi:2-oxoacid:acceptor oxidoreductase [Moraxella bovoculi]|uniref:2-oxoacid:acceptor oxidoreductase n=1 Tax=Moraxella bovoculi TaxID=386891 RepID=UPI000AB59858|nr:2-oxoacid:acceptor oxidoreductase [Moraxella bovoculi]
MQTIQHEIFIAGTRADNSGKEVTITPDDLNAIAQGYNPSFHEAPIVIGHPDDNAPAYDWVKSLSAQDGKLFAEFGEMDDDFVELVKAGRYKKVSASFYPPNHPSNPKPDNWYLRHIGFLGALPPAVKGLSPVSFNDSSDGIVSFGELSESEKLIFDIKSVFARFFNFSEAPVSQDNNPNPSVSTDEPSKTDTDGDKSDNPNPTQSNQSENTMNQDVTEALARAEKAEAELAKFKAEQAKKERDVANAVNANFAENLVKDGKIKPCDKELLTQVLNFAEFPNDTTADFGEGDDKKPLAVAFKEFLGNLPKQHSHLTDKVTKSTVNFSENMSHHERATALMKSENISYEEAARRTA